ncbi:hypothetical protein [Polaribacter sp. Hel1_85]|uniref:hypothetical protein n=1 Tax=Polaribacter sp. Hel1_85 TaxID=1250005 RepID=UPI00052C2EA6|nr:hypothetical protein [Polaribacter sp. Hel1_85]KGL62520.1 hypothetical protein PHEL85_2314 [Polaribacter sp. Hel1_85]
MRKMYRLLMLFSLMLLMSFTSKDCSILKNNSFTYRNAGKDVLVVFEEAKHAEYHNNKEFYIKSDIEWVNDCEYYLIIKETTLPNFPFKMGTKMHIVVNKVKGKKIYYTSSLGGKSWEGRLTKIKR